MQKPKDAKLKYPMNPECLKLIEECKLNYQLTKQAQIVSSTARPEPAKIDEKSQQEEDTTLTIDATVSTSNDQISLLRKRLHRDSAIISQLFERRVEVIGGAEIRAAFEKKLARRTADSAKDEKMKT